jgi:hypothetical protein
VLHELSRVRTDLDALEDAVFDLLMSQAYFLTDAHMKVSMRAILDSTPLYPDWTPAHDVVRGANTNAESTLQSLRIAQRRSLVGRMGSTMQSIRIWTSLVLTALLVLTLVLIAVAVR